MEPLTKKFRRCSIHVSLAVSSSNSMSRSVTPILEPRQIQQIEDRWVTFGIPSSESSISYLIMDQKASSPCVGPPYVPLEEILEAFGTTPEMENPPIEDQQSNLSLSPLPTIEASQLNTCFIENVPHTVDASTQTSSSPSMLIRGNAIHETTIDISATLAIEMIDLTTPSTIDLCTPEDRTEDNPPDLSLVHSSTK